MIPVQHIHPMLVHFPIVFFLSLAAFDVVAAWRGASLGGRSRAGTISFVLALLAGLSGLATFVFGGLAMEVAEAHGLHSAIAEIHEGLGGLTAAAFAAWALVRGFLWWRNVRLPGLARTALPLIEVAGAVLVTVTAWYGGQLVYDLGVNVGHVGL